MEKHLRIVPYRPEDYSLGDILAARGAKQLKGANQIAAALSLYFQWTDHRSAYLQKTGSASLNSHGIELDYDRDEAAPSELRVRILSTSQVDLTLGSPVLIRFEIFRVCYEFLSETLAISSQPTEDGWNCVIQVPQELLVRTSRELPRYRLDASNNELDLAGYWVSEASPENRIPLKFVELGLNSIRAKVSSELSGAGKLFVDECQIPTETVRASKTEVILALRFPDISTYGRYFDTFRKFAYPSLRSRYDFEFKTGLDLYSKTTYFSKYEGEKSPEVRDEIAETWKALRSGFHETNADYYITDAHGAPCGTSGLALTHIQQNIPVWTFHQLCALKQPELLERSGHLYLWRAEYLAGRPERLLISACFHSKSRWIERLYIKHAIATAGTTTLRHVRNVRRLIKGCASKQLPRVEKFQMGKLNRYWIEFNGSNGAISPKHLNANQNLDTVIAGEEEANIETIFHLGEVLVEAAGLQQTEILFTLPGSLDVSIPDSKPQLSDRYSLMPKSDLMSFMASIAHSLAVTKKKLELLQDESLRQ